MTGIDLSDQLDDIRSRYPEYWNSDEAFSAGIHLLIAKFEGVRDCKGSAPQNQSALAQRMIETLKEHLSQARQLSLF